MEYDLEETLNNKMYNHYAESLSHFNEDQIIGVFLYGNSNYDISIPNDKIKSKLITVSSEYEIGNINFLSSTTHTTLDKEWVSFEDIRFYFNNLKEQDLSSIEILFTNYFLLNETYEDIWNDLIEYRELIARMNPCLFINNIFKESQVSYKSLLSNPIDKQYLVEKFGYNPEQLYNLLRLDSLLSKYIDNEPYEECIKLNSPDELLKVINGEYKKEFALKLSTTTFEHISSLKDNYFKLHNKNIELSEAVNIIDKVEDDILAKFKENG